MRTCLTLSAILFAVASLHAAEPDASIPAIEEIKGVRPSPDVFKDAKRGKPLELKTADEAAKYFGEDALAATKREGRV